MAVRIATRGSALARWQAEHVAGLLRAADPALEVQLVIVHTEADARLDIPIAELGGKGAFTKEVQVAVLDGRADLAVHSAKDLPALTPEGLVLAAVPARADPRDALVGSTLAGLVEGASIATGSARRRVQLAHLRPDLTFSELRGNIATRLERGAAHDAIVVAVAALDRLGLSARIDDALAVDVLVPQVGQGALAIECRADDEVLRARLVVLEHTASRTEVDAERSFLRTLGGDCDLPAGAHARTVDGGLVIDALLASPDETQLWRAGEEGDDPIVLGRTVAERLLADAGT